MTVVRADKEPWDPRAIHVGELLLITRAPFYGWKPGDESCGNTVEKIKLFEFPL